MRTASSSLRSSMLLKRPRAFWPHQPMATMITPLRFALAVPVHQILPPFCVYQVQDFCPTVSLCWLRLVQSHLWLSGGGASSRKNNRFIKCLEETPKVHLAQPPANHSYRIHDRWPSKLCLKTSKGQESTTFGGNWLDCWKALGIRKLFLIFS